MCCCLFVFVVVDVVVFCCCFLLFLSQRDVCDSVSCSSCLSLGVCSCIVCVCLCSYYCRSSHVVDFIVDVLC